MPTWLIRGASCDGREREKFLDRRRRLGMSRAILELFVSNVGEGREIECDVSVASDIVAVRCRY